MSTAAHVEEVHRRRPTAPSKLRIAVVAPPFYEVPPRGYGGIEAVVALLVDGLVDRGHDVTLFAAGRPKTKARGISTFDSPQADRLGQAMPELVHAARVATHLADLAPDVVHDHSAAGPAMARGRTTPTVVTSHGPATGEWGDYLAAAGASMYLVAISHSQVRMAPHMPWRTVIHNGIDVSSVPCAVIKHDHLAWIGRFTPDKGAHLAIDIAHAAGRRILLAGRINGHVEQEYFAREIRPRLGRDAQFIGEVHGQDKYRFLGSATALVFPLQWEEPFGMVLIEAMACGTPVLSLARGAVPEIVADGVTGYVRQTPDALVDAIARVHELDPQVCREHVEESFTVEGMVSAYECAYRDCLVRA